MLALLVAGLRVLQATAGATTATPSPNTELSVKACIRRDKGPGSAEGDKDLVREQFVHMASRCGWFSQDLGGTTLNTKW